MPQRPLSPEELPEFRNTLERLDALVASSTLIALRQSLDDYPRRGWCASEFFLGSSKSFERGIFIDTDRLQKRATVLLPERPSGSPVVMHEAYEADLAAFRAECEAWTSEEQAMVDVHPPGAWAAYRSLQGSGFHTSEQDPNPFRLVLDSVRALETTLFQSWLMADRAVSVDLAELAGSSLRGAGLRCSESSDLVYLALVLGSRGWIEWFRPLFREGLARYLDGVKSGPRDPTRETLPVLNVRLQPLEEEVRLLFSRARPASAATWHSRLAIRSGLASDEKSAVEAVRLALDERPPAFRFEGR
jgi:hypothetical protein